MIRMFLVLGCLMLPAVARAQSCADAQNQMELTQCAYREWQVADAELNAVYPRVMAMLKAQDADLEPIYRGGPEALRDAQRAWIVFRDKTCEAEGFAMRGGSAEPMVVAGCLRTLTTERIGHLYGMLDAFGG